MRVAAICDVHGNLPALEAVLHDVRQAGVDQIVVAGDVLPGPMPVETLAALANVDLPVQFIHGNGDRVVLAELRGGDITEVPEAYRDQIRWVARQLGPDHERMLADWPATARVDIPGLGDVVFCHATPRNDVEIFTSRTPEERLVPIFEAVNAPVVVCGHTHIQFDRMVGRVRVVNAGSVGMPFQAAGAYWLLLGPEVRLQRTSYDLVDAAERIRGTSYPRAAEFAARHVLQPPSAADTMSAFAAHELR